MLKSKLIILLAFNILAGESCIHNPSHSSHSQYFSILSEPLVGQVLNPTIAKVGGYVPCWRKGSYDLEYLIYLLEYKGNNYYVLADADRRIVYIEMYAKDFTTPEGVKSGDTLGHLMQLIGTDKVITVDGLVCLPLPSGWTAVFTPPAENDVSFAASNVVYAFRAGKKPVCPD
jgi:hypothetical protein